MRFYWYWPFAREEYAAKGVGAIRDPDDELLMHVARRPGAPAAGRTGRVVIDDSVPDVAPATERSLRWAASRAATYVTRSRSRAKTVDAYRPDVVHVHFVNYFTDAWAIPRLARRRPTIVTIHDAVPHASRLPADATDALLRRIYAAAPLIVLHTAVRDVLVERFDVDPARVSVVPPAVPTVTLDTPSRPDTRLSVLLFGALRRNKGIGVFLEAMRSVERDDVRIVIAGRGFADVEAEVREAAQSDSRIETHLGWVEPSLKSQLYSEADLVVLPYTSFASNSGVLHDAYGHGVPVVVTDVGALGDEVRDGGTGWVAPPDAAGLAAAISTALDDAAGRAARATAARAIAEARTPEMIGAAYREVYDRAFA